MKSRSCPPRPNDYPVAARDRASLEVYFGAANVMPLASENPDDVLLIVDKKKERQVWVRPSNAREDRTQFERYRQAYEAVHGPVSNDYDVDHVQSQKRAGQNEYRYVRLCRLKREVNQAWGRRWEGRLVRAGNQLGWTEPDGPPPIRQIDQFQWWKVQGLMPGETPYGDKAT